jgi:hypothetical protein
MYFDVHKVKLEFYRQIMKNTQKSNFVNIRPVRGELFYADGRTDMMKVTVALSNFATAPKPEVK